MAPINAEPSPGKNTSNSVREWGPDVKNHIRENLRHPTEVATDPSEDMAEETEPIKEEEETLQKLQAQDQKIRQHEQAHLSAAGSVALGGAHYETQEGPDGNAYAISGHVNLDMSPASDPASTIAKAQVIQRAALAPSDPSPQDFKVAVEAAQIEAEARTELKQATETYTATEMEPGQYLQIIA
jgi:hypothetical protein